MKSAESDWLESIAARAAPLWESISAEAGEMYFDFNLADDRLARWRHLLGSELVLGRRFLASPLPRRQARLLLGLRRRAASPSGGRAAGLPSWTGVLRRVLSAKPAADPFRDRALLPGDPLPFEEALLPFVRYGRARVARRAGAALAAFAPAARIALERQLLAHLAFVAQLALGHHFSEFRFRQAPASAFESQWRQRGRSTAIYQDFIRHLQQGGLRGFFGAYPVLARLLCRSVELWEAATLDLMRRFRQDFALLRDTFGWPHPAFAGAGAGAVAGLIPDLSDRHDGGRTVAELLLATGERIVYKPRPVESEQAFYALVDWLNHRRLPLELRQVKVVPRAGYGWAERVPRLPCASERELERFYRRSGMLLALLHVLSTTDIHCENLIASGEHPVVVDLETILTERRLPPPRGGEEMLGWDPYDASVLRTGFLPRRPGAATAGHPEADLSALGAGGGEELGIRHFGWRAINTDQMALAEEPAKSSAHQHRARLGANPAAAADYREEVLDGFAAVYLRLLSSRDELLADRGLLERFDGLELRVLLRGTMTYSRLHLLLLHPEYLRDGIDRSIELEWLARPLGGPLSPQPGRAAVYEQERRAMEDLDIPRFASTAWKSDGELAADEDLAPLCGDRDSRVIARNLQKLSTADLERQLRLIRETLAPRRAAA